MNHRRYLTIHGHTIAYSETGTGLPVVCIHGFGSYSITWESMCELLPTQYRIITVDLLGFGYSDKPDISYSMHTHIRIIGGMLEALHISEAVLMGHSYGGAVCLALCLTTRYAARIRGLILIDSAGYVNTLPLFIAQLRIPVSSRITMSVLNAEFMVRTILRSMYHDPHRISDELVKKYAEIMHMPEAQRSYKAAARSFPREKREGSRARFCHIRVPTLVVWGAHDTVIPVSDAHRFVHDIRDAHLEVIPSCGHSPHEECPQHTATIITAFLRKIDMLEHAVGDTRKKEESLYKRIAAMNKASVMRDEKMHMRRLVDRWSLGVAFLFVVVKLLQGLRWIGVRSRESGWRKAARVFLRTEHAKFTLAVFRLDIWSDTKVPHSDSVRSVEDQVIDRLRVFLKTVPVSQWRISWKRFSADRARQTRIDIVHALFHESGRLLRIRYISERGEDRVRHLSQDEQIVVRDTVVHVYNEVIHEPDVKRPLQLQKKLYAALMRDETFKTFKKRSAALLYAFRILNATFISFEEFPSQFLLGSRDRLKDPDFIKRKHPGFGLLNIVCRIGADHREVDLWVQAHHVPVDGVPMQELLTKLKQSWGVVGPIVYPSLRLGQMPHPERCSTEKGARALYHARTFIDFRRFLALRKELNKRHFLALDDDITAVSMIIWGLAHQDLFKDKKFLFTVDVEETATAERSPSVVFIRPSVYFSQNDPLRGFISFQRAFNQRLQATRVRKGESYELLEAYALTSPLVYSLTRKVMPHALAEFVGSVGVTMVKDADLFITPLSDIHTDGFFAFGNFMVPTEDGDMAGSVSVRGTFENVPRYIEAVSAAILHFEKYI